MWLGRPWSGPQQEAVGGPSALVQAGRRWPALRPQPCTPESVPSRPLGLRRDKGSGRSGRSGDRDKLSSSCFFQCCSQENRG